MTELQENNMDLELKEAFRAFYTKLGTEGPRYFDQPGVLFGTFSHDLPEKLLELELSADRLVGPDDWLAMYGTGDRFLDVFPAFRPLEKMIRVAVPELRRSGFTTSILSQQGGCSSCRHKKPMHRLITMFGYTQTLLLQLKGRGLLSQVGTGLREFLPTRERPFFSLARQNPTAGYIPYIPLIF